MDKVLLTSAISTKQIVNKQRAEEAKVTRNTQKVFLFKSAISPIQTEKKPREIKANQMTQNTQRAFSKTAKLGRNQPY